MHLRRRTLGLWTSPRRQGHGTARVFVTATLLHRPTHCFPLIVWARRVDRDTERVRQTRRPPVEDDMKAIPSRATLLVAVAAFLTVLALPAMASAGRPSDRIDPSVATVIEATGCSSGRARHHCRSRRRAACHRRGARVACASPSSLPSTRSPPTSLRRRSWRSAPRTSLPRSLPTTRCSASQRRVR